MMEKLNAEEAAVYDRQIRLWGVEAQQRLRKAKVLLIGISSLGNEVSKNIILAGIKHLTILDDENLSEADCEVQFMCPKEMIGQNKAEASVARGKELNPMVDIVADTGCVSKKDDQFFKQFDVVCMTQGPCTTQKQVNEICRRLDVKFLCADVFGYYGYLFADFTDSYTYVEEKTKVIKHDEPSQKKAKLKESELQYEERTASFCSMSEALQSPLFKNKSLHQAKQVNKSYLVMQVMFEYFHRHNEYPSVAEKQTEVRRLLEVRDDVFERLNIDNHLLDDEFASYSCGILYPVYAIMGGVMGQEVIKAVSGRGTPHNNFFFYDARNTSGHVINISPNQPIETRNQCTVSQSTSDSVRPIAADVII